MDYSERAFWEVDVMAIEALVFDAYGTLYDVQTVAEAVEAAFPGRGDYITQVWRLKQLEYTWLRSVMGSYEDFWTVTRESLAFTLKTIGIEPEPPLLTELASAYNRLRPYPETADAIRSLAGYRLAILSNGSPDMLGALLRSSGLERRFEAVLSVDAKRTYKPDPRAYSLVEEALGVTPEAVLFVTSNGFDVGGAKSFGFRVARIERVAPAALQAELASRPVGPAAMYKALRTQEETGLLRPDLVISSLSELPSHLGS